MRITSAATPRRITATTSTSAGIGSLGRVPVPRGTGPWRLSPRMLPVSSIRGLVLQQQTSISRGRGARLFVPNERALRLSVRPPKDRWPRGSPRPLRREDLTGDQLGPIRRPRRYKDGPPGARPLQVLEETPERIGPADPDAGVRHAPGPAGFEEGGR